MRGWVPGPSARMRRVASDSIQSGELHGDVLRIGIRSSTVRTSQGAEVIVPNSKMIEAGLGAGRRRTGKP